MVLTEPKWEGFMGEYKLGILFSPGQAYDDNGFGRGDITALCEYIPTCGRGIYQVELNEMLFLSSHGKGSVTYI